MMRAILVFWLLASCLEAAQPVARISGIDETSVIEPGDPLEFQADSLTDKERCKWKVLPEYSPTGKPTFKVSADRKTLTLYSRSGTYTLSLFVWNDSDLAETTRIITVGKPIQPKPDPIPPPDPQPPPVDIPKPIGMAAIVRAAVVLNVPAGERQIAKKLAANYREMATSLTTDAAKTDWAIDPFEAGRKAIKTATELNTGTPGYKADVWRPVFQAIATRLSEARDAGQFDSQKEYVAVFAELSQAFSGAAE